MHDASVHTGLTLGERHSSSYSQPPACSKARMGVAEERGAESLMSEVSGEGARNGEV